MSRSEHFPVVEADHRAGAYLREAHRIIEQLPEDNSLQRLNKIAADLQLFITAVRLTGGNGSRQSEEDANAPGAKYRMTGPAHDQWTALCNRGLCPGKSR